MRPGLKVALSLLITTVIFSLFFLFAFSGLFYFLETKFYSSSAKNEVIQEIKRINSGIEKYHAYNIEIFSKILLEDYITRSFLTTQLKEDIENREQDFYNLKQQNPQIDFIRFIGLEGKRIHFSTLESDIKQRTSSKIVYYNFFEVDQFQIRDFIDYESHDTKIFLDEKRQSYVYCIPIIDNLNVKLGNALFYINIEGLKNYIINNIENLYGDIIILNNAGIIVDFGKESIAGLKDKIINIWENEYKENEILNSLYTEENQEELILFSIYNKNFGFIGLIKPEAEFEMKNYMKVFLMSSLYLTLFLIIFFIFNIKKDYVTIFTHKIKKFQIQFLMEFINSKEEFEWRKLRNELIIKSSLIKHQFKTSLGKYNIKYEDQVNELINKSWDEILNIIGAKEEKDEKIGLNEVVKLLKEILRNTRYGVAPGQIIPKKPPLKQEEFKNKEEIDDFYEEIEEAEEPEEAEEIEEAEEVEEEEIEEAEEPGEVEEALSIGEEKEADKIEELEKIEEIAALPPEPFEELDELESTTDEELSKDEIGTLEIVEPTVLFERIDTGPKIGLMAKAKSKIRVKEDFEDLEILEEAEEFEEVAEEDIKENYIRNIEHFSIDTIIKMLEEESTAIIMEDGVYRIKDEVYTKSIPRKSRDIGLLARAILGDWKSTMRVKDTVRIPVIEKKGLSLDYNFEKYKYKDKDLAKTKFLVNISRMIDAVCMVILKKDNNEYISDISIGIDNESKEKLKFKKDDFIFDNYMNNKDFVIYKNDIKNNSELSGKFSNADKKYIKSFALLPSVFNNNESYILFGFSGKTDISEDNIIKKLSIV